jgi:hypothetical protein
MKTAKEIADEYFPGEDKLYYKIAYEGLIEEITEYAKEKCAEQRQICAKNTESRSFTKWSNPDNAQFYSSYIRESIVSAPEPKFD